MLAVNEETPMSIARKTQGFIAAPFTPFHTNQSLNLEAVDAYAHWLNSQGCVGAFICGTTGESASLTVQERKLLAERWVAAAPKGFRVIVHVGHVTLHDCCDLAQHAQEIGADSTACLAPYFFRPNGEEGLLEWCQPIAAAAPELPFYYYHIPSMTGFPTRVSRFLELAADRIPNLVGVKFTHDDLDDLQACLQLHSGKFDLLFGKDEMLLTALALGVRGAVGSTYNFAAPLYRDIVDSFLKGDQTKAAELQEYSAQMVRLLFQCGPSPLAAFKRLMSRLAIDCGPVRLPLQEPLDEEFENTWKQVQQLPIARWLPTLSAP
jgi:N-acetylneuraminate lyase